MTPNQVVEQPLSAEPSPQETPVAAQNLPARAYLRNHPDFRKYTQWAAIGFWGLCAVASVFAWLTPDLLVGDSLFAMIFQSGAILSTVVAWLWFVFLSRYLWSTVLPVVGLSLVVVVAGFCSIRRIDMTGSIWMVPEFVWQPPREEAVRKFQAESAQMAKSLELVAQAPEIEPEDMPAYRGVNRDGILVGPPLAEDWSTHPPKKLWEAPIGEGFAQFAVVGNLLVTIEQVGPDEVVSCYNTDTGFLLWKQETATRFDEFMGGPGPRATPTIDQQEVFALGANGDLNCLDLLNGERKWHVNILKENNLHNSHWAMSSAPLIADGLVIVNPGGPKESLELGPGLAAYDRRDGHLVWKGTGIKPMAQSNSVAEGHESAGKGENAAGYASPVITTLGGVRQIVLLDGVGLRGCQITDGKQLWFHPFTNGPLINVSQPVLLSGDRIFLSASYNVGAEMVQVTQVKGDWKLESKWKNFLMRCKFTSPVLYEGHLYGLDEGIMVCLDAETGQRKWKAGRYNHGQLLLTNNQLLVLAENGDLALIRPTPEKLVELGRVPALQGEKNWNPPALSRGRLYLRNHLQMAAFDLRSTP